MDDEDLKQLIDYLVYAPVGIITSLSESLPNAVETGRNVIESRTMVAKFIGKIAVDRAGSKVKQQVEEIRCQVTHGVSKLLPEPWGDLARYLFGVERSAEDAESDVTPNEHQASDASWVKAQDPKPSQANGSNPALRLVDKSPTAQESKIEYYSKVSKVDIDTIIPRYPTLSASQVVSMLTSLREDQLQVVIDFEEQNRCRRTIISKATNLLGGNPNEAD